jgi:hypothetical protein
VKLASLIGVRPAYGPPRCFSGRGAATFRLLIGRIAMTMPRSRKRQCHCLCAAQCLRQRKSSRNFRLA